MTVRGSRSHGDSGKSATFTTIASTATFSVVNDSDLIIITAFSVTNFSDQMPVCAVELNKHSVKVFRDTGCNGGINLRSLVNMF